MDERVHILLTPDEASVHGIENFPKEVYQKKSAEKEIRFWRSFYGGVTFIGVGGATYFLFQSGLLKFGNFFYEEGMKFYFFPPPPPSPPPSPLISPSLPVPDPTVAQKIKASVSQVIETIPGVKEVQSLQQVGNQASGGLKKAVTFPVRVGRDWMRRWNQKQFANQNDFYVALTKGPRFFGSGKSPLQIRNTFAYYFAVGGIMVTIPLQVFQAHYTKRFYFQKFRVNARALEEALKQIWMNADLACRELGRRGAVKIRPDQIQITRFTKAHLKKGVYLRGQRLNEDELYALGGSGSFYVTPTFKCRGGILFPHKKSINQLIQAREIKPAVSSK